MALLDIFKRKKREEYVELGTPETGPIGPPSLPGAPETQLPGMPGPETAMPSPMPSAGGYPAAPPIPSPDMQNVIQQIQTLNYKLDALKAVLDTINTRLANIETALKTTPGEREGWTY